MIVVEEWVEGSTPENTKYGGELRPGYNPQTHCLRLARCANCFWCYWAKVSITESISLTPPLPGIPICKNCNLQRFEWSLDDVIYSPQEVAQRKAEAKNRERKPGEPISHWKKRLAKSKTPGQRPK